MINIEGLNKAEILKELYRHAKIQGMGMFAAAFAPPIITIEICQNALQDKQYIDYLFGRVIKVDLFRYEDSFDERLYDRDNGEGKAQYIIDKLRAQKEWETNFFAPRPQF